MKWKMAALKKEIKRDYEIAFKAHQKQQCTELTCRKELVMWRAIMRKPTECSWNGPRRKQWNIKWTIWKLDTCTKIGVIEQSNPNNFGIEKYKIVFFFQNRGICDSLRVHPVVLIWEKMWVHIHLWRVISGHKSRWGERSQLRGKASKELMCWFLL